MNEGRARWLERVMQGYIQGKFTRASSGKVLEFLKELGAVLGGQIVLHYSIEVGQDTIPKQRAVRCPACGRPTVYFLPHFGPACSGDNGGCARKAPLEKRLWYIEPYVHDNGTKEKK